MSVNETIKGIREQVKAIKEALASIEFRLSQLESLSQAPPVADLRFTIDSAAWAAGLAAGESGLAPTACPYPKETDEALPWYSGFIEGKAKRESMQQ